MIVNMPKANITSNKKTSIHQSKSAANKINNEFEDEPIQESLPSSDDDLSMSKGKKRSYDDDDPQEFNGEMQKMLECFGADISKTLSAKRKRLENYTQSSLKTTNKKVDDIWKGQNAERQKLNDEFKRQVVSIFTQWESDLDKSKDQEEKFQNLLRQQQKLFQQTRVIQSQRLKTIRQLHDQYIKGMMDLEKTHQDQQCSVHTELRKEMALLQKKILIDTQQQEMMNVRKSLQTMLF